MLSTFTTHESRLIAQGLRRHFKARVLGSSPSRLTISLQQPLSLFPVRYGFVFWGGEKISRIK